MADITKLSSMMPSSGEVNQKVNLLLDAQAQQETNTNVVSSKVTSMFSNLDRMEESMSVIRKSLNRDIRSRERYYNEEVKLLKKELKTTESLKGSLMNVAALVAGVSLASALGNFQQGNLGAGARDLTFATGAALSQYLPEVITGSAIIISQLLGFGKRGSVKPQTGMRAGISPRGGAGKLGLLLPLLGLMGLGALAGKGGEGDADKVRGELVRKQLVTDQTINQPDVDRFKLQLERFSFLIDRLRSDRVDQISPVIPRSGGTTAADGTKITSSGLFPNLMKNNRLMDLQNILQEQSGGRLDQIGGRTVPVSDMTLSDINQYQADLDPEAASGVGLFNIDDPLGAVEEMFDAKGLKFDPKNTLFTEPLQRELGLFQINQALPEGQKLSATDLTPFKNMDAETLGGFLQTMPNIKPNTLENEVFDLLPLFEAITEESDVDGSGDDKISSNTFVMPNNNNDIAMIDGNAGSASVTVSTDYSSNDGVTIDNFHNIIQYDSPAIFGGVVT